MNTNRRPQPVQYARRLLVMLLLPALLSLPAAAVAQAQGEKVLQINVESDIEPVSAVGLVISSDNPLQLPASEIMQLEDNRLIVSVPYNEAQIPRDALATAMVIGEEGRIAFGNMRPVFAPEPKESFLKIPLCAPEKISQSNMEEQLNLLESLIELRNQRRQVAQKAVLESLSGDFLIRLQKLEENFGIANLPPLGPALPPVALIDRLGRVLEAVKSYEAAANSAPDSGEEN